MNRTMPAPTRVPTVGTTVYHPQTHQIGELVTIRDHDGSGLLWIRTLTGALVRLPRHELRVAR